MNVRTARTSTRITDNTTDQIEAQLNIRLQLTSCFESVKVPPCCRFILYTPKKTKKRKPMRTRTAMLPSVDAMFIGIPPSSPRIDREALHWHVPVVSGFPPQQLTRQISYILYLPNRPDRDPDLNQNIICLFMSPNQFIHQESSESVHNFLRYRAIDSLWPLLSMLKNHF